MRALAEGGQLLAQDVVGSMVSTKATSSCSRSRAIEVAMLTRLWVLELTKYSGRSLVSPSRLSSALTGVHQRRVMRA